MKLVKATRLEINRDHNGQHIKIPLEGVTVEDQTALELSDLFGSEIEISEVESIDKEPVKESVQEAQESVPAQES